MKIENCTALEQLLSDQVNEFKARDIMVQHVLAQCKIKLEIYRDHSAGEYHGGIEHTALIRMIDGALRVYK